MKDEIKEKIKAYYIGDDIDKVLDYITNLEQENERYKHYSKTTGIEELMKENEKVRIQISAREEIINKAIEYIRNHQLVFELSSKKQIQYWFDMFYEDLINILQGEDKDA